MQNTNITRLTVTIKEFSAMTGIGQNRVRQLCYTVGFPAIKEGNKFLIHLETANEWLRKRAEARDGIAEALTQVGE